MLEDERLLIIKSKIVDYAFLSIDQGKDVLNCKNQQRFFKRL